MKGLHFPRWLSKCISFTRQNKRTEWLQEAVTTLLLRTPLVVPSTPGGRLRQYRRLHHEGPAFPSLVRDFLPHQWSLWVCPTVRIFLQLQTSRTLDPVTFPILQQRDSLSLVKTPFPEQYWLLRIHYGFRQMEIKVPLSR